MIRFLIVFGEKQHKKHELKHLLIILTFAQGMFKMLIHHFPSQVEINKQRVLQRILECLRGDNGNYMLNSSHQFSSFPIGPLNTTFIR